LIVTVAEQELLAVVASVTVRVTGFPPTSLHVKLVLEAENASGGVPPELPLFRSTGFKVPVPEALRGMVTF
jgi:hypothetical protein